jgi:ADP-heptose:LPS heptosyltransferase
MIKHMNRILIIRRDNIGDLICTTPLIHALRTHYPQAELDVLVNSYNFQAIEHNPDINNAYAYTKGKHRESGQSLLGVYWQRLKLTFTLRRKHYDLAILASGVFSKQALKLASSVNPKQILSLMPDDGQNISEITVGVPTPTATDLHEVQRTLLLLQPLGISPTDSPLVLRPDPQCLQQQRSNLQAQPWYQSRLTIGIHISSRKPSQRWPEENFTVLIKRLHEAYQAQFLLFWAPGDENNPRHPGDDQKAQRIVAQLTGIPVLPIATSELRELIAGIDLCDHFICSDGGAMHIAAGLGKPMVCFFGESSTTQWRPWGVPHALLQAPSRNVADISVDEALAAYQQECLSPPPHSPANASG